MPEGVFQMLCGRPVPGAARDVVGQRTVMPSRPRRVGAAKREALLAAIVDSSSDAMVSADARHGRIMTWNAAAERLFGYTEAEAIGAPVSLLVPPELAKSDDEVFSRALRGERVVGHQTVRVAKDGRRVHVAVTASQITTAPGRMLGVAAIFRDITARKRDEERLRSSEAGLRRLLDTLDLASLFVRDLDGTIRFWSGGCERLYGWTTEEAVGRVSHQLLATSFPTALAEVEAALLRDGRWSGDLVQRTKGGEPIIVSTLKVLRKNASGQPVALMETVTNVTAQRRAEAALAASEASFRAMADAMPNMVWTARADGSLEYLNARWYEFAGVRPSSVESAPCAELVHPDERALTEECWSRSLATGEPFDIQVRMRRSDGEYRRVLVRAVAMRDAMGTVMRWFGSSMDIEEIVRAREVIARDREELERLVQTRTRDLEETQSRLAHAQRMEALGQLAGGIAHDFNNVLQAVQGGLGLIERRSDDPEAVLRLARLASDAADRGSSITRRLLTFSRRSDLRAEPVDGAALLEGMRDILAHTLGASIQVVLSAQPHLTPVLADRGQLETVLVNLATNARDAMPGGGTLTLSAEGGSEEARPDWLGAGAWIRISVADTGTGMRPETLERACEPFFTTKPQGQGTGLGLAMARGFAEQSGGALVLRSAPDQGTTVSLWLPAAERTAAVPAIERCKQIVSARPGLRRMLLVDDEEILRDVLAEQLEEFGYEVAKAESGEEALALLDSGAVFDVLLTDLSMPGMDGIALIREAQCRTPRLPAILLTGYAGDTSALAVDRAVAGSFNIVSKPITAQRLVERIATLISIPRDQQEFRYVRRRRV